MTTQGALDNSEVQVVPCTQAEPSSRAELQAAAQRSVSGSHTSPLAQFWLVGIAKEVSNVVVSAEVEI